MKLLLVLCAAISAVVAYPGLALSIEQDVIQSAKSAYFQTVLDIVNKIKIPDLNLEGKGYLKNNKFNINSPQNGVGFNITGDDVIQINVQGLSADFSSQNVYYDVWKFIKASGSLEAKLTGISLQLDIGISTQILPNGKQVPSINILYAALDIPSNGISLTLHGNYLVEIAEILRGVIQTLVRQIATQQVENILHKQVSQEVNQMIAAQNGVTELAPDFSLDWSMEQAPFFNADALKIGLKGLFFPTKKGEINPLNITAPLMPFYYNKNEVGVEIYVSNYLVETFANTAIDTIGLNLWVTSDMISEIAPIKLNTGFLDSVFPGLGDKYGPNQTVDAKLNFTSLTNVNSSETNQTLHGNGSLYLELWVHVNETVNGTVQDTRVKAIELNLTNVFLLLHLEDYQKEGFLLHINNAKVEDINCTYSSIGDVSANIARIKNLIQNFLGIALTPINFELAKSPIVLSGHKLLGLFELSNTTLEYYDSYLKVGATPTFLPPSPSNEKTLEYSLPSQANKYRYTQTLDENNHFSMWDSKAEQYVEPLLKYQPDQNTIPEFVL